MCHLCDYTKILKAAGIEPTTARQRVLKLIGQSTEPVSAQEICDALQTSPKVHRATVFRTLELLVQAGILERISSADHRSVFYDLAPNQHHKAKPYFYCRYCNRLQTVEESAMQVDVPKLMGPFGGHVEQVQVQVVGICPSCLTRTE